MGLKYSVVVAIALFLIESNIFLRSSLLTSGAWNLLSMNGWERSMTPPSSARAGEWPCRPARTVQAAGDSDWGPCLTDDGDPPPPPVRAREWPCRPVRTVQAAGDSDRGPATANPPPSLVRARDRPCHPARTVLRPMVGLPRADLDPGQPARGRRGTRQDLATLQSTVPLANLGGRRPTCKGHAPTYSLYTVSGH